MDKEDLAYFNDLMKEYGKNSVKDLAEDLISIYKEAIQETVYDAYSPVNYADGDGNRTYQLLNNVSWKIEGDRLLIYTDVENMYYSSAVDGREVTELIPYLINTTGHNDNKPIQNMYHHYPARNFLEKSQELIKRKYPQFEVTIINDVPPQI